MPSVVKCNLPNSLPSGNSARCPVPIGQMDHAKENNVLFPTVQQAAGRVWRDGQRKRVFVYRFLSTGTIEEKVLHTTRANYDHLWTQPVIGLPGVSTAAEQGRLAERREQQQLGGQSIEQWQ
eukprot:scaffold207517_cov41-Prasinocladus_malaysianus.AAC.1